LEGRRFLKLLLDTHIWIWTLLHPEKVGRTVRRHIENRRDELFLSPISVWEAQQIERRKRLRLKQSFAEWLPQALAQVPVREAPFTFAVATAASRFELPQPDPADTFLAATALVYDLTLVTADTQLLDCAWLKTMPNE
jgi:PIN domain nuclease of toxin-antitoxin system